MLQKLLLTLEKLVEWIKPTSCSYIFNFESKWWHSLCQWPENRWSCYLHVEIEILFTALIYFFIENIWLQPLKMSFDSKPSSKWKYWIKFPWQNQFLKVLKCCQLRNIPLLKKYTDSGLSLYLAIERAATIFPFNPANPFAICLGYPGSCLSLVKRQYWESWII